MQPSNARLVAGTRVQCPAPHPGMLELSCRRDGRSGHVGPLIRCVLAFPYSTEQYSLASVAC